MNVVLLDTDDTVIAAYATDSDDRTVIEYDGDLFRYEDDDGRDRVYRRVP